VWAAAQPWVDYDLTAQEAARRTEERLAVLHPQLIVRYQQGIAEGLEPVDAMADACTILGTLDFNGAKRNRSRPGLIWAPPSRSTNMLKGSMLAPTTPASRTRCLPERRCSPPSPIRSRSEAPSATSHAATLPVRLQSTS